MAFKVKGVQRISHRKHRVFRDERGTALPSPSSEGSSFYFDTPEKKQANRTRLCKYDGWTRDDSSAVRFLIDQDSLGR